MQSSFATFTVPAHDPEAMPLPRVVSLFPLVGHHRAGTHFNYQWADKLLTLEEGS
jgi:hypothetical protein